VFTPQQIASKGPICYSRQKSRAKLLHKTNKLKGRAATQDKNSRAELLHKTKTSRAELLHKTKTSRAKLLHKTTSSNRAKEEGAVDRGDPLTLA
jgi:hypothetical protein